MKQRNESNTIIRTNKRENPYVMIDKYGLNDERISWKAKGLLAYLLSKPDDWQVYERDLIKRSTDGRDAVRTALRELETYGYLSRRQVRGENGSFGHVEYVIYERPIEEETIVDGKSVHGSEPSAENPSTGFPLTVNPTHTNKELNNNDLNMIDCMSASAEVAAASEWTISESESNELIEALNQHIPTNCYVKGIPLGQAYITEIYLMLLNQFSNQLSPEVVRIASELYFDRSCATVPGKGIVMKIELENPTGFFQTCYKDAVKLWKVKRA